MGDLEIIYEPTDEPLEYEIVDGGKVVDNLPAVPDTSGPSLNIRTREEIAEDILQRKLAEMQRIGRFLKFRTRAEKLRERRETKTAKRRKKNKLAKASRKRNWR